MKQFKLTFLLAVLMSMVGARALAYDFAVANADGKAIYYSKTSETEVAVTFKMYYNGSFYNDYTGNVVIPEFVTYNGTTYSVTSIGSYAFKSCSDLTSVTIPNSITSIGRSAFYGCSGLTSITIPNSVTGIGSDAFYGCSGLTSVTINSNSIVSKERSSNSSLKTVFGDQVKNYIIGDAVTSIGQYAFYGCTGLTSVTIPNSVTNIGSNAFNNTYLKSVTIGTGVLSIGSNAFYYPVKVIWLTNTPPNGYTNAAGTVNYVANDQYTNLSNKTVYPFLSSMFEVGGVKYVPVSPSERTCDAIDCVYGDAAEHINIGTTASYMGIDMTVLNVKPYVCYKNVFIKDILLTFNNDVPQYAFYGCNVTNSITVSNQGNIGYSAFADITGSYTASVNNTGSIGNKAFQGCTALQTATLGADITSIGSYAFDGCSQLQGIVIPDAVTTLGEYAFHNCTSLASATTGNGITAINTYTFWGCTALTNMQIGSSVKTIDTYAFRNCRALAELTIPSNVTSINDYVFSECYYLAKVTMADSQELLTLGSNGSNPLFADCPLDEVYIGRNISYSTSSSKGYSPFYRNTSLRAVTITDKETEISQNEFYGCTGLKQITIGDGVESIGDWAFSGCSSLESFSFGYSVETIGQEAFSDCTAMTTIVSRAQTPPTCGTQALDDINKFTCKLKVPQGYLAAYQQADQWKEFFFIEDDVEGVVFPTVTAENKTREYGEENPELTYTVTDGELTGTPELTTEAVKTSPVGDYAITVNKGSITGKYNAVNGTLSVTKAPLKITAQSYTIKQGQPLPEFAATYEGFKNEETEDVLTVKPTMTTTATSASEPGEYDITVSGAEADNYEITYVKGKLTITDADAIIITAKSYTRKYGEENPVFEYTVDGAALEGEPQITCEATKTSPVGTYPIVITKGSVTNYNDTYVNGTLTIEKAPLTVKAEDASRTEGEENPTFVISYEGFKNGETEDVLTVKPTATTDATQNSPAGIYVIVVSGGEAQNYTLNYINGTLTVTESTGIESLTIDSDDVEWYTLNGLRVKTPRKGVYIVKLKDGTMRKVVVK